MTDTTTMRKTCEHCHDDIQVEEPWEFQDADGRDHYFCSAECRNTHADQTTLVVGGSPVGGGAIGPKTYNKPGVGINYVRLDRHCPRCCAHRNHTARRRKEGGRHVVSITCAECGHDWAGRFRREEWSDGV